MIVVPEAIIAALAAEARAGLPNEVCGYLAGKGRVVSRHYPLTNTDAAPDHFSMDPAEQFAAVRDMRGRGLALLAVYHSHPETPARPSEEDIRLAFDPEMSYVIVSLALDVPQIKSFRIKDGKVREERIETGDNMNAASERIHASRDCRGVGCPMNLVYTKVELAKLRPGQVLEVILDHGAPIENVPRSITREGHEIAGKTRLADGCWRLLVRKAR
jgi:proteasome lid subunit RPN8/RPN11/TusA-related sulfurtransferase